MSAQVSKMRAKLEIGGLAAAYRSSATTPSAVFGALEEASRALDDPAIWITPPDRDRLAREAEALERMSPAERAAKPLWGIPFAVKDNIDVAGLPTTAACPAFSTVPETDAPVVARLKAAGAVVVGKTNLDQFATGLVGVRSPYGVPRNPFDAARVPGGSSSGSAVAVARGLAAFSLGTDTAGSGRIPAAFCNLVGLKPTRGLLSTEGVVPACRSLDCVSIFAHTIADTRRVLDVAQGLSSGDPYGRPLVRRVVGGWMGLKLGVPDVPQFFGDALAARRFEAAIDQARFLGATIVPVPFGVFEETAALLYGPWVAERVAAVGDFIAAHADDVLPVTRKIIESGRDVAAADLFRVLHRLEALKREADAVFETIDALMVPTAPIFPTLADLDADPIGPNTRLGTYTNFVNLLDLAAIAVPAGFRDDGLPAGVTFIGPAMTDHGLADLAEDWSGLVELAVVGAHLEGQPLHHELAGAPLTRRTSTAANYRLYALNGTMPPKPGLVRSASGAPIEVEVYALDHARFGRFVAGVPAPLAIGTVTLSDGSEVKGFVCEPAAVEGAQEITRFGGWRAYRAIA